MFRWFLLVLVVLAALSGLALGVLNPDPVAVDLGLFRLDLSLGAALAAAMGFGLMAGLIIALILFAIPARLRRRTPREQIDTDA